MQTYPASQLEGFAQRLLQAFGSAAEEAGIVARHLVTANLSGHDSHGIHMLRVYAEWLRDGVTRPNTAVRLVEDFGSILRFDGGFGFGQRVALEATDQAAERARESGLALWTLTNAMHVGRIGHYGERLVEQGLAGIFFVNVTGHAPFVAPHGGRDARLLTNPICIAVPGDPPFLLDMATSQIALGKVEVAKAKRVPLGAGLALDAAGEATVDPLAVLEGPGALLPAGFHKGFGLAVACEILAGIIGGGGTLAPQNPRDGTTQNHLFALTFAPDRFGDVATQRRQLEELRAYLTASPPRQAGGGVLLAGDPERAERAARGKAGVAVPEATVAILLEIARTAGVSGAGLVPFAVD